MFLFLITYLKPGAISHPHDELDSECWICLTNILRIQDLCDRIFPTHRTLSLVRSRRRTFCFTDEFLTAQEIFVLIVAASFAHALLPTWNAVLFLVCLPPFRSCAPRSHHCLCQYTLTTPFCEFQHRLALHCVLFYTALRGFLWACSVSVEDQILVPFMVLTYSKGPINTSYTDLKVSTGIEIAKGSVKTLLGGYFRHSGLSLGLKFLKIWQLGWVPSTLAASPFTRTPNLVSGIAAVGSVSGTLATCSWDPRAWQVSSEEQTLHREFAFVLHGFLPSRATSCWCMQCVLGALGGHGCPYTISELQDCILQVWISTRNFFPSSNASCTWAYRALLLNRLGFV